MTIARHLLNDVDIPEEVPFELSEDRKAEARISELAVMTPLEYEKRRADEAKALGMRASVLDKLVEAERPTQPEADTVAPFEDEVPWDAPVDGNSLLREILSAIRRFCVLPEHSAPLMAAWTLHAWTHDAADISPVLAFVSPEKRCGKTTALSIMGAVTPKSMHNVNVTTSVLFRVVEQFKPTVLIDEADTYLADNDELRGILNGGHPDKAPRGNRVLPAFRNTRGATWDRDANEGSECCHLLSFPPEVTGRNRRARPYKT